MNSYVYRHRRLDTNEIFYIGIGRLKNYKRAYQNKKSRNIFWQNIVAKTKYEVEIIADNLSWDDACELEMLLISEYGRRDLGLGTLVNLTNGGDGNIGMSQEQKDKISKALTGKKQSDETKLKRSITSKESWKNPDLIELKRLQTIELNKLGLIGTKGKPSNKKGIPLSDELKQKTSEGLKKYYENNKPHNYKIIEDDIKKQIICDFESGINKFQIHKKYKISRSIIARILNE